MNHKSWHARLVSFSSWSSIRKVALPAFFIALLWSYAFPLEHKFDSSRIAFEILLLAVASIVYGFLLRLRISTLTWGWSLFLYSLWLDFIAEFTQAPEQWDTIVADILKTLGFTLIAFGFYRSHRLFQRQKTQLTEEQICHLTNHDALTGLPNRTLFQDRLEQATAEALRQGQQVALLLFDLDRFKEINDSLTHDVGNKVLRQVAHLLRGCLEPTDMAFRIGGDEFAVIQSHVLDLDEVVLLVQHILNTLSAPHTVQDHEIHISASIGITLFPTDASTTEQLLKNANIAMYRAKHKGRNNYQLYALDINVRAHSRLVLTQDLRKAFETSSLYLQFQPQLDLASEKTVSFEALLRWHHRQHGLLSRQTFIRLAEETGLIVPIGAWVLETACKTCFSWQQRHPGPLHVAVNLSPCQFHQPDLAGSIAAILETTKLPPTSLEVEITEGLLLEDMEAAEATLQALSTLGVHIAVDDFGTGHSSLTYLKRLPFDSIKIDRSFIHDILYNTESQAITKAIIGLGHSLDLKVVAEGVETLEQLQYLRKLGCNLAQGYFISKPLDSSKAKQWWEKKAEKGLSLESPILM